MVTVATVEKNSPAAACRIAPGDRLVAVNGHAIHDFLDYDFYTKEDVLVLEVETDTGLFGRKRKAPKRYEIRLEKGDAPLGLGFDSFLMDEQRTCRNGCIFCFIDQMPPGMRPTLYVKDDDARMSFLFGNYITMTNLSDEELSRIITMHISPINVSVHTTNPDLRCKMMQNRFAGNVLERLEQLAAHGITLNCQLVLCPGYNDGQELARTLKDLSSLGPCLASVSAVPVGKTKFRQNLTPIQSFDALSAGNVIDQIEAFAQGQFAQTGRYVFHASDEFYLVAGRPLPDFERYDDFAQLANGVGMCTLLEEEFELALNRQAPQKAVQSPRYLTLATGVLAAPLLQKLCDKAAQKFPHLNCRVVAVQNDFFGPEITVAGLVCGCDLLKTLQAQQPPLGWPGPLGQEVLITEHMLESTGLRFLDDMTLEQLKEAVQLPVCVVGQTGEDLLQALLGVSLALCEES